MPTYEYKCKNDHVTVMIQSMDQPRPCDLLCEDCGLLATRRFSFDFNPIQNEIHSPSVGKHGSTRSYNTARDRLSAEHSERTGQAVTFETFDARDSDQDPTKKLK